MNLVLSGESISKIEEILDKELLKNGVKHAFIVDASGNLITEQGELGMEDLLPLAALAAANFGATERMANIIGERDFTLLFHKGRECNIHFCRMNLDFILVTVFNNDVPVGLIRLGSSRATEKMLPMLTA